MYQFKATATNNYTIDITSNTYWSCKSEGNFKLSEYCGSGDTVINIEIPDDVMKAEGVVYFSYGDERCKYPDVSITLTNLCYIKTNPSYTLCENEKTVYFFYEEPNETFYISVFCFDNWSVDTSDFNYITNNNDIMIISSGIDGELRIIPKNQCNAQNIVHVKLVSKEKQNGIQINNIIPVELEGNGQTIMSTH